MDTTPAPGTAGHREDRPLAIRVTAGGRELLVLRALARQAIPMLADPHAYGEGRRLRLADRLAKVLRGCRLPDAGETPPPLTDADMMPEREEQENEPGCLPEDPRP